MPRCARTRPALRVVGNLPYNVSTPLLFRLLAAAGHVRDMHFMLQREVVERIVAVPGNRQYGRLGVMLAPLRATRLLEIGPARSGRRRGCGRRWYGSKCAWNLPRGPLNPTTAR